MSGLLRIVAATFAIPCHAARTSAVHLHKRPAPTSRAASKEKPMTRFLRIVAATFALALAGNTGCPPGGPESSPFEGVAFLQFTTRPGSWEYDQQGAPVVRYKGVWPLEWASESTEGPENGEDTEPSVEIRLHADFNLDDSPGVDRSFFVPLDPETGYLEGALVLATEAPQGVALDDGVCLYLAYTMLDLRIEHFLDGQFVEVHDATLVFDAFDAVAM